MLEKYFGNLIAKGISITSRYSEKFIFIFFCISISSIMISIFLMQLLLLLLFVLYLFEKFEQKKNAIDGYTLVIFLFGFCRLLAIIFSNYPDKSIISLYKESLLYIGILTFGFYAKVFYKKINIILIVFFISSLFVAIVGIAKFDLGLVNRSQSFSSGYSVFSLFLTQSFILLILTYRELKFKNSKILWAIILGVMLVAIITSLGRTNIVIAFIVLIYALVTKKIDLKPILIVFILTGSLSFISFQLNNRELTQRIDNPLAPSDRDILWEGAAKLAFEHPLLGFGTGTFHEIFPFSNKLADKDIGSWQNEYISIYIETGIIGLLSYLFLIFYLFRGCIVYFKKNTKSDLARSTVNGIVIILISYCIVSITSGFIISIISSVQFAFLVALFSSVEFSTRYNRQSSSQVYNK